MGQKEQIEEVIKTFRAYQARTEKIMADMQKQTEDYMLKLQQAMEQETAPAIDEPEPPPIIHFEGEQAKLFYDAINAIAQGIQRVGQLLG